MKSKILESKEFEIGGEKVIIRLIKTDIKRVFTKNYIVYRLISTFKNRNEFKKRLNKKYGS